MTLEQHVGVGGNLPAGGNNFTLLDELTAVAAGDHIILLFMSSGSRNISSITDVDGETVFSQIGTTQVGPPGRVAAWHGVAAGASAGTELLITLSGNESEMVGVALFVVSGLDPEATPQFNGSSNTSVTNHNSGQVTPATATNFVAACMRRDAGDWTDDADFTQEEIVGALAGRFIAAYREQSAATTQEYNATAADPESSAMAIVSFDADEAPPEDEIEITAVVPNPFTDYQANIGIAGVAFGAAQGAGMVELGDNATYGSANLVEQTVTAWADDSITFTAVRGDLPLGALYLFVTNNDAERASFPVTLQAPAGGSGGRAIQQRIRRNI